LPFAPVAVHHRLNNPSARALSLLVTLDRGLLRTRYFNAILAEKISRMSDQNPENNFASEIAALKQQFDGIRAETENFVASVKTLSDRGVGEAKEMLESAKDNWHGIKAAFEGSTLAKLFTKAKKKIAKKKAAPKKAKVAAKKLVKKATKKVAAKKAAPKKKKK